MHHSVFPYKGLVNERNRHRLRTDLKSDLLIIYGRDNAADHLYRLNRGGSPGAYENPSGNDWGDLPTEPEASLGSPSSPTAPMLPMTPPKKRRLLTVLFVIFRYPICFDNTVTVFYESLMGPWLHNPHCTRRHKLRTLLVQQRNDNQPRKRGNRRVSYVTFIFLLSLLFTIRFFKIAFPRLADAAYRFTVFVHCI